MRFHGTNVCINCTCSTRIASSFVLLRNITKYTQTLRDAHKHEFRVQWGWIGSVCCEKFQNDFMAQTCALIAPVQPVLQWVSCSNETLPNAPKHYETHTNLSLGSNGVVGCVRCEKFWCDFMARTSALIALVQPILHRVSCSKETLPNAPKHYKMHQNLSLGSNGVDRFRSLRKILMRLHGTNFCISCTSSTRFVSSIVQ